MSQKDPLVSVVMATFNGARFLEKYSISSVLSQSYDRWELIVVDDGSSDDTAEIVRRFQEKDDRIRLVRHDANKGLAAAMNSGIRNAGGEFTAFLEHDDAWLPDKLRRQVDTMNVDPDIVSSEVLCWAVDAANKKIINIGPAVFSGMMVRTAALREVGPLNEGRKLSGMQDGDFTAMLDMRFAPQNPRHFHLVSEPLAVYMGHADSLSSREKSAPRKFIERYAAICEKYDTPEFSDNQYLAPALGFWYIHLGLNLLLIGDRAGARKKILRSLKFKESFAARIMLFLSFFPVFVSRSAYWLERLMGGIRARMKVRRARRRYASEYHEALRIIGK